MGLVVFVFVCVEVKRCRAILFWLKFELCLVIGLCFLAGLEV